jgi:hypothetical protein
MTVNPLYVANRVGGQNQPTLALLGFSLRGSAGKGILGHKRRAGVVKH